MIKITSPNFDKRMKGATPLILIIHYTGMGSALEAMEVLCDPIGKVSAHYFIDEDGSIVPLVPEDKRAWHAGISYWKEETDINSHSIGIELVNRGHEYGYRDFTQAQMEALIPLCQEIVKKHDIKPSNVVGHSDVAPERKLDPGELFDWKRMADAGVGLWPDPTEEDFEAAGEMVKNEYAFQHLLTDYGYNPLAAYVDVVTAFHRHFYPEKFEMGDVGQPDETSAARLLAIVRESQVSKT